MPDPQNMLASRFTAALVGAFGEEYAQTDPLIAPAKNPEFGDYQANVAMSLARPLRRSPREIAQAIIDRLDLSEAAETPTVAGPGFINIRLSRAYLAEVAGSIAADDRLGVRATDEAETVVIDYSSPNVAKEMHVGHLRSSVIGDAIARVLEFAGHEVIRQNHLGDWGTQFGMLIEHLNDQGVAEDGDVAIGDLNAFYKQAKAKFDTDPAFADRARERVVALQSGDQRTLELWRWLVDASAQHFEAIYDRLGVQLTDADVKPESFYNPMLPEVVRELREAGLLTESQGAQCVFVPGYVGADDEPVPLIVQKADGGFGYAATDLAAVRYRRNALDADRMAYVVDARQGDHFDQVFWVAGEMGWLDAAHEAEHVKFGTILGEDGRPFKTRSGETVKLVDLLDEAEQRAAAIIAEKDPEFDDEQRAAVARVVGIGAVKYGDLSGERTKDYKFDWSRMLAFEGNTAPYLQNAYVRARSIFRKAGLLDESATAEQAPAVPEGEVAVAEPAERALVLLLARYPSTLEAVGRSLEPHRLCNYLYDVATAFHRFYETCPVLKAEPDVRDARLRLADVTARLLRHGLGLLGIETVERM